MLESMQAILVECDGGEPSELLVISNLVVGVHLKRSFRRDLTLVLDGVDSICESVLFSVVFRLYFNHIFLV